MDTSKTAPGPGATENFPGVFLIVDKGEVEIGADKQDFREYFFNGKVIKGRIIFRRLDGQTSEKVEKHLGGVAVCGAMVKAETLPVEGGAPANETSAYWLVSQPEDQTPYVLSAGAVESGWLPPVGVSALPKSIRDSVPEALTFWSNADNKSREEKRKELMEHLNVGDATATTKKLSKRFAIVKSDDAKMVVTGIVYEPDVVDGQGDYADADAIEKAAYDFMEDGWLSLMHERKLGNDEARLVESYVAPVAFKLGDTPVRKGTWIQSWKLSKTLWDKVKGGEYTGFSLEGDGGE